MYTIYDVRRTTYYSLSDLSNASRFPEGYSAKRAGRQVAAERNLRHHGCGNILRINFLLRTVHPFEITLKSTVEKIFSMFDARRRRFTCGGHRRSGLLATTARKLQYMSLMRFCDICFLLHRACLPKQYF